MIQRAAVTLSLLAVVTSGMAQMPGGEEMVRAVAAAEPSARDAGITLRIGTLWLAALRDRAPMLAAYGRGVCQLGYSAYTPGRDYRWLFPLLPAAQREAWLAGLVQHELAHCLDQADSGPAAPLQTAQASPPAGTYPLTDGGTSQRWGDGHGVRQPPAQDIAMAQRWQEVLADLAFALHVDHHSPQGQALIQQLAGLREAQQAHDPAHNTAAELRCYLRLRQPDATPEAGLAHLKQWRKRCWQGPQAAP